MLENALIELFDLTTFEEAFKKTGRHITVTVSPADLHQHSRLLNAKTSPNAIITQAVRASCAVPIIFSPVQLRAKTPSGDIVPYIPNRRFADGSLMADLPFERLARLYGVNHNILPKRQIRNLSQVLSNPTRESINQLIVSGERASWPQLHVIKRNTKISENLRYHLGQLKKREAVELGHEVR